MWYLIDLIIVAILLICVLIYSKRGFIKSVFGVVGFVVAVALAFALSGPLSNFTYENAVKPTVTTAIEGAISDTQGAIKDNIIEALPSFIKNNISDFNMDNSDFIASNIDTPETMAEKICESVVRPTATYLLEIIFFLILFIVLSIVLKFVVKILNKVFSFSIVGKLNSVLGGVIGIIMGVIFALIFTLVINLIVSLNGGFSIFTGDNINNTLLFKWIINQIPINL